MVANSALDAAAFYGTLDPGQRRFWVTVKRDPKIAAAIAAIG